MATLPSLFRRLRNGADPLPSPPAPRRVSAPPGARHCVLLVLDSCRFDSFAAAQPRVMSRLGALQRRYAYATWTAPSHYNLLMGLLPHPSPTQVFASDHYKQDFLAWGSRLGLPDLSFVGMLPRIMAAGDNPMTSKPHSFSSAEAVANTDKTYNDYLATVRNAAVQRILARGRYDSALIEAQLIAGKR